MAPTVPVCDPCCQNSRISAMQSEEHFRSSVLILMCDILAGQGGGGGGGNVNLTGINGVAPSVGAGAVDTGTLRTTLAAATTVGLSAGSAIVGKVGIDQTTPGTTNAVVATLAAGSAIAGKVGIDQTTPGTTNKVSIGTDGTVAINAAIPTGSNIIGRVGIDQTTPGTTNKVSIGTDGTVTLAAGSALAGKVGIDQTTPGTTNAVAPTVVAAATGWTGSRVTGGLSTTVTQIKGSVGKLGAVQFYNPNSAVAFIQMFKVAAAASVTLGTTVPDKTIGVPPLQSYAMSWGDAGTEFANGIQVAATTTSTGNTAPTTPVDANFDWK